MATRAVQTALLEQTMATYIRAMFRTFHHLSIFLLDLPRLVSSFCSSAAE